MQRNYTITFILPLLALIMLGSCRHELESELKATILEVEVSYPVGSAPHFQRTGRMPIHRLLMRNVLKPEYRICHYLHNQI